MSARKASPVQGEVSKIYLIFDGGVDNPPVKIGSEEPILPIACGQSGRGSGCPPDSHSLPRLRFAYPCAKGGAPQGRRDCLPHRFYEHGYMILRLQSPRNRIGDSISTPFAQGGLGAVQAAGG